MKVTLLLAPICLLFTSVFASNNQNHCQSIEKSTISTKEEKSITTTEPWFNFYCDNKNCPVGDYQLNCPLCSAMTPQGKSNGYLSCTCFNPNAELQNVIIYSALYKTCNPNVKNNQVSYMSDTNTLKCFKNGSFSPSAPIGPGLVPFKFVCATTTGEYGPWSNTTNCPTKGNYQSYCPRCTYYQQDDVLKCYCFNNNKSLTSRLNYLFDASTCSSIDVNTKAGTLVCN